MGVTSRLVPTFRTAIASRSFSYRSTVPVQRSRICYRLYRSEISTRINNTSLPLTFRWQNGMHKLHFMTSSKRLQSRSDDTVPQATAGAQDPSATETTVELEDSDSEVSSAEDTGPITLTAEEIQTLSGGDEQVENKIQFILMEHELMRQEGNRVPRKIAMKYWPELLDLRSKAQRIKYYGYLWNIQMSLISQKRKKKERTEKRLEQYAANPLPSPEEDPYYMFYGLNRNTIFLRLYDTKIATTEHHRVISEMVLGSAPLIIDCGYDDQMQFREAKNCAAQLEMAIAENRMHPQPFDLSFCNANPESNTLTVLRRRIPTLYSDTFALNVTNKSYTDLYPHDRLVYLSPHARDELTEFNHDEIYIIGAIVDKSDPRPFSIAKAKKEGIRLKKLPLDTQIDWGVGSKSLTINQLVNIMLEVRATGDWEKALRFVPRRKLVGGRRDCVYPKRDDDQGSSDSFRSRRSQSQPPQYQVFKDYELVAQRRRGFVYEANDDDKNSPNSRQQQRGGDRPYFGNQRYGNRNVKTIMSDND